LVRTAATLQKKVLSHGAISEVEKETRRRKKKHKKANNEAKEERRRRNRQFSLSLEKHA